MIYPALGEVEAHAATSVACRLLGIARASVYRWRAPRMHGPAREPAPVEQPAALTAGERAQLLATTGSPRHSWVA